MVAFSLLYLTAVVLACNIIEAQPLKCDAVRPPENSNYGYRARGNRCEGLFVAEIATASVDLVSFTKGEIPQYTLAAAGSLHISLPPGGVSISIRGLAKPVGTYYRMDTTLAPGKNFDWPVDAVLKPEHIDAANLGVVAWKRVAGHDVYVPIEVTGDGPRHDVTSNKFSIRPAFEADAIQWRYAKSRGDSCEELSPWKNIEIPGSVMADHAADVRVVVPANGTYCVYFGARMRESGTWVPPLSIRAELMGQ